ncbi:helix-turn-helix domain-containing protein, partial [Streptomyces aurantiacus]|uniref:helix-turn-helix domain-containing protein n=1 Tax=Streptomyces aurantiacus TaxID=47760 RepID=UPI0012FF1418
MTDGQVPKSVLARGAALLRACGESEGTQGLAELALRTGLPKPTAHRLLAELVRLGQQPVR